MSRVIPLASILVSLAVAIFVSVTTRAQTLPSGVYNTPPTSIGDNESIGSNTTVNVLEGGSVGSDFVVGLPDGTGSNVALNVLGGYIDDGLEVHGGSVVHLFSGDVGGSFDAYANSVVNLSGGSLNSDYRAFPFSQTTISGGVVSSVEALGGSVVDISGGRLAQLRATSGSLVNLSGGAIDRGAARMEVLPGSQFNILGGEFLLNGLAVTTSSVDLTGTDVLTTTLEDGSVVVLGAQAANSLSTLNLIETSVPPLDNSPIFVDSDGAPRGLRAGQTLTMVDGGRLGDNFSAANATLDIQGGSVGHLVVSNSQVDVSAGFVFTLGAYAGTVVEVTGGEIQGGDAYSGSVWSISDGTVGVFFNARAGSVVNISGGSLGTLFRANTNSEVNISGGSIGDRFVVLPGAEVNLSGGTVGPAFEADAASQVTLLGGEYRLNGAAVAGATVTLSGNDVLTGTFEDGAPFIFSKQVDDDLQAVSLVGTALPAIDLTPMVVNGPSSTPGLRSGQALTLTPGGVLGNNFSAVGATLSIEGGAVGQWLEVSDTQVAISGGTIEQGLHAFDGSVVDILGGSLGSRGQANAGSVVNLSDGSIGFNFQANAGSVVNIAGGTVDNNFVARDQSVVNISGGEVGFFFDAEGGSEINISGGSMGGGFDARTGSEVNLTGYEFLLNDQPIEGLTFGEPHTITERNQTLTGIFADGMPFSFDLFTSSGGTRDSFAIGATLTVTLLQPQPGDFDFDGDVDGTDFLVWQRAGAESVELGVWQANYGASASSLVGNTTGVPEPGTMAHLLIGCWWCVFCRSVGKSDVLSSRQVQHPANCR